MRPPEWSGDEFVETLLGPVEPAFTGSEVVITSPPTASSDRLRMAVDRLTTLPGVVIAAPGCPVGSELLELVDVVAHSDDDLAAIVAGIERAPLAAQAAALLLRGSERRSVVDGLVAESAVFSALQAGPEHRAWRARTPLGEKAGRNGGDDDGERVELTRTGSLLEIRLRRPGRANSLDVRMRDELLAALAVVEADPELRAELGAEGPVFCAGGDLDEFGTASDPATAHLVRLRASIGAVLARVADRISVWVQGPAAGSGVELAAFAGRVVANPDARFVLPELELGLVPGAGGTVSLPRRIGRHRTAWMLFTGEPVDAPAARSWGLVDEIQLF